MKFQFHLKIGLPKHFFRKMGKLKKKKERKKVFNEMVPEKKYIY